MIKSKIDARERALELAVAQSEKRNVVHFDKNGLPLERDVIATAQAFETYLIGDAELPETEPTAEDVATKAIERLLSAYGLNGGEEVKPRANAVDVFPVLSGKPMNEVLNEK